MLAAVGSIHSQVIYSQLGASGSHGAPVGVDIRSDRLTGGVYDSVILIHPV